MIIKENIDLVKESVNKLFDFAKNDADATLEIHNFLKKEVTTEVTDEQLNVIIINFIFDEKFENGSNITELYLQKNSQIDEKEKKVFENFHNTLTSIFEVKKLTKNAMELYNLVNEKTYNAKILGKMVDFRGVCSGNYMLGRIFKFEGEYYILNIDDIYSSTFKEEAYKIAVSKLLANSELLYADNEEKLKEIQEHVLSIGEKYKEYFQREEIITTTEYVDGLLSNFEEYLESNSREGHEDVESQIKTPENYAYFDINKGNSSKTSLAEVAAKGFSSHERIYDVGVLFDNALGLVVLPFYGTFKSIFASENYTEIEGYKECVLNYLDNENIPITPLVKAYNNNPESFKRIIKEVLELENEIELEQLLQQYKQKYIDKKIFSSPTVLYSSKSFNELMLLSKDEEETQNFDKVKRNDQCPCGSGKKFKKCCLNK